MYTCPAAPVLSQMDEAANAEATEDSGCEYSMENFGLYGNCVVDIDCNEIVDI